MPRPMVLAVCAAVALGSVVAVVRMRMPTPVPAAVTVEASPSPTPPPSVVVDVTGAVVHPGVVRLAYGARVADALAAAGGVTAEADLSSLNRAALLRDGARVHVPRVGETPPAGGLGSEGDPRVDLNHASALELQGLPGIGPATAARIIRSRDQRAFTRIEELQTRGLVTARVFMDIRGLVAIR